jgi:hypothetical protein
MPFPIRFLIRRVSEQYCSVPAVAMFWCSVTQLTMGLSGWKHIVSRGVSALSWINWSTESYQFICVTLSSCDHFINGHDNT